MNFSKPVSRVKLVSIGAKGVTIDELLTVKIAPKTVWLKQGVGIGDAGLCPIIPLRAVYKKFIDSDFFERFEMKSVRQDGIDGLQYVGGDGDGHEYIFGLKSQQFFILWHGAEVFEPVAKTSKAFIQWVIRNRSDHLEGCPWEVLLTGTKRTFLATLWHRDHVDPLPLLEKARASFRWDREYVSPLGFELLDMKHETRLRFKKEHRGHNSHFWIDSARKTRQIGTYLDWLAKRGFGRKWC